MVKWSAWKSVLAGAVIGFVEAAGPDAARRRLRSPLAVVRIDHQRVGDPPGGTGLWILDPLPDPRAVSALPDHRPGREHGAVAHARLRAVSPIQVLRAWWPSGS